MTPTGDWFRPPAQPLETRWATPENPRGARGAAGRENGGRKGRAHIPLRAGESCELAREDADVSGTIRRFWLTLSDRSPRMLRGLRLDFFWDGAARPAVSAPLGDFFGVGLGQTASWESDLFSSPEGRSFNCFVPMPFRSGMRLALSNETNTDLTMLFYEVDYTLGDAHDENTLYLHAHFHRENPTTLRRDYAILPSVMGRGRFLGVNLGVLPDRETYGPTWWGEGEVKIYLNGDTDLPTLCGTGTEDYIGTGWAQGLYSHRFQGCTVAGEGYCFYRWHIPDPVYFRSEIRVTHQQIGHAGGERLAELARHVRARGDALWAAGPNETPAHLDSDDPRGVLFERSDDVSSCAYFYLDRAENDLPPLLPPADRYVG